MKKQFLFVALAALGLTACQGGTTDVTSDKETALQQAVTPYVNNTVIATYSAMADAGMTLLDQTEQILDKVTKGEDYSKLMEDAGTSWRLMRKHWEQSEAFLYGPAASHNIDPHIDSWPLDFNAMNALLHDEARMAAIEEEGGAYVGDKLGYALKGFHAAEYLLFESVENDGRAVGTGRPHAANLTHAEAVYLYGIVEDLTQQAILLEYCWAGEVSPAKMALLEEGEVDLYEDNYGWQMCNAGKPGSIYVSYQEAAEEIIAGCVDIAGEVAELKMGNPYISSTPEERDYIESPYSCTSTIDFRITSVLFSTPIVEHKRATVLSPTTSTVRMPIWTHAYAKPSRMLSRLSKRLATLRTPHRTIRSSKQRLTKWLNSKKS